MPTYESFKSGTQFSGRGIAADPLELVANTIDFSFLADLSPSPAGSYNWGTVNAKGIVTAANDVAAGGGGGSDVSQVLLTATSATGATLDLEYWGDTAPVNADLVQTTVPGTFTFTVPADTRLRTGCFIGNSNHVTTGGQFTFKIVDTDGRTIFFIPKVFFLDGAVWKEVDAQYSGHNPGQDPSTAGTVTANWLNMGYDDFMILFQFVNRYLAP